MFLLIRGTSDWLLAVRISGLQQTLEGCYFRVVLWYRMGMQMFLANARCSSSRSLMDIYGDHALLCRGDAVSASFQLHHRLVQRSLVQSSCRLAFAILLSLPTSASREMMPQSQVVALGTLS